MLIKNSILSGFNPDPTPCRFDDDYCIFTSAFERFFGVQMNLSCDLADWRLIGHAVQCTSQPAIGFISLFPSHIAGAGEGEARGHLDRRYERWLCPYLRASRRSSGKLFLRIMNRFAEFRLSWSTDWTTVDHVFDATMIGDRVSPHSNFIFTFWGICCQDLSSRFAWANFDCFNYQPPNMP